MKAKQCQPVFWTLKEYGRKKKIGKYVNYVDELLFYIANWASRLNKTWELWKTNFYLNLDHFQLKVI